MAAVPAERFKPQGINNAVQGYKKLYYTKLSSPSHDPMIKLIKRDCYTSNPLIPKRGKAAFIYGGVLGYEYDTFDDALNQTITLVN